MSKNDEIRIAIRQERKKQNLSQSLLANKMFLSLSAYGKLERGETEWTASKLELAENAFGKTIKIEICQK